LRHTGLPPGQLLCSQPGQETGWLRQEHAIPASWLLAKNTFQGVLLTLGPLNCRAVMLKLQSMTRQIHLD